MFSSVLMCTLLFVPPGRDVRKEDALGLEAAAGARVDAAVRRGGGAAGRLPHLRRVRAGDEARREDAREVQLRSRRERAGRTAQWGVGAGALREGGVLREEAERAEGLDERRERRTLLGVLRTRHQT